ncbi:hypothetical protein [Halomarina oriensis]|uniref:Uncharacterized protein n=1 Tax=Halomarina oriensis TaxID=671145 RepID=A0A6B0GNJ9_9EURY|nr:hypothetical protein [Halomarina oriensis]MWG36364.1 hypothetical protein [Halomarina oriensis]
MSDNPFADLDDEFGDTADGDGTDDVDESAESGRPATPAATPAAEEAGDDSGPTGDSTDPLPTDRSEAVDPTGPAESRPPESTASPPASESNRTVDPTTTAAFEYSPAMQQAVYPRPETWQAFEDAMELDMERVFRAHDVRNMSKREIHDALFSFVVDNADEIARRALSARGIDTDDETDH